MQSMQAKKASAFELRGQPECSRRVVRHRVPESIRALLFHMRIYGVRTLSSD